MAILATWVSHLPSYMAVASIPSPPIVPFLSVRWGEDPVPVSISFFG